MFPTRLREAAVSLPSLASPFTGLAFSSSVAKFPAPDQPFGTKRLRRGRESFRLPDGFHFPLPLHASSHYRITQSPPVSPRLAQI